MNDRKVDPSNALLQPRGNYAGTLEEIVAAGFCPFCEQHLFKHHPNPVLMQNEHWIVTENGWPYAGSIHHLLFIARAHMERTEDLTPESWRGLHELYRMITEQLDVTGGTLFMRSGDTALTGATVNHLHAHFVVGVPKAEDTATITALIGFRKK